MSWRQYKQNINLATGTSELDILEYDPVSEELVFVDGVNVCLGPDRLGNTPPYKRTWWCYSHPVTGDIWAVVSDAFFTKWELAQRLLFVPSGSTNPTIVFDDAGKYIVAVEFLPAGSEQKEIWLYKPPYSGAGIRKIADGQHPILARSANQDTFLFYQVADKNQVLYRKSSEEYSTDHVLGESEGELLPRGFRVHHENITPYHDRYKHLMFYQDENEKLPRYKMSTPTDLYTVGLDLYVTDLQGRGISGVHVVIAGQSYSTDTDGLVTFYKLPYGVDVEVEIPHPSVGLGDTQSIFIPESAKGTHVLHSIFFKVPKVQESVEPDAEVSGITWQGTEYIEDFAADKLSPGADVGIEWEVVRSPEYEVEDLIEPDAAVGSEWVRIYNLYQEPEDQIEPSAEVSAILWVEV